VRDQIVNFGVAAIAGVTVLGLWTVAFRILSLPYLLFESLWRISFPGMARLLETGADPRPVIERSIGLSATLTGLLLAGIVGLAPVAIPALLGTRWTGAAQALPWACLGLMTTSISTASAGYLFARGDAATVLRTTGYQAVALLTIGLGLLPWLGLTAIGLGWLAAHVVDGIVIGGRVRRLVGADVVRPLLAPAVCASLSAAGAWFIAKTIPATVPNALLLGVGVFGSYVALHATLSRSQLLDLAQFIRRRPSRT
jgi:O-antigen/teichoic acid export membrane protein